MMPFVSPGIRCSWLSPNFSWLFSFSLGLISCFSWQDRPDDHVRDHLVQLHLQHFSIPCLQPGLDTLVLWLWMSLWLSKCKWAFVLYTAWSHSPWFVCLLCFWWNQSLWPVHLSSSSSGWDSWQSLTSLCLAYDFRIILPVSQLPVQKLVRWCLLSIYPLATTTMC